MCLILHVNLDALLLIPLGWYSVSSKVVTAKVHEGNSNEFFLRLSGGKLSWWHRRNTVEYRSKESDTLSIIAPNAYSSWWTEKLGNETNGVGASEKLIAQIENVFCKKRYMEIRTILWVNWLDSECIVALISAVQLEISIYFLSAGSQWRRNLSVQRCFPKPKLHVGALCFENWKLRIENWELRREGYYDTQHFGWDRGTLPARFEISGWRRSFEILTVQISIVFHKALDIWKRALSIVIEGRLPGCPFALSLKVFFKK